LWEDDLLEKLRFIKGKTASGGFAYAPVRVLKSDRDSLLSQRPDSEFLSTPQDFLKAVEEAMVDLARKKLPFHPSPALGAMIELPAVLDIIHELAKEADFFPSGPTTLFNTCWRWIEPMKGWPPIINPITLLFSDPCTASFRQPSRLR
jgi:hypothetical protein